MPEMTPACLSTSGAPIELVFMPVVLYAARVKLYATLKPLGPKPSHNELDCWLTGVVAAKATRRRAERRVFTNPH